MDKQIYLSIIMVICGIIGGVSIHITTDNRKFFEKELIGKILYGVIAAFLVPLFLNTISSNLIENIGKDVQSIYIFIGFCLIASISSKVFITTLTEKTINSLKEKQNDTKNQVEQISNAMESIVAKNTDISIESNEDKQNKDLIQNNTYFESLDQIESKLLFEFGRNEKTFLTVAAVAQKMGTSQTIAQRKLKKLRENEILTAVTIGKNICYGITINGIEEYKNLVNSIEWTVKELIETSVEGLKKTYRIIVESDFYQHELKVYSSYADDENIGFRKGDKIIVKTVDGNKVHSKNVFKR